MARSQKDNVGANTVDAYRKQIAKQDSKKNRISLQESKYRAQMKENAPSQYKDVATLIAAMLVGCLCVYCIFYALLTESTKSDRK